MIFLWGIGANWEHAGLASQSKGFDSPIFHQINIMGMGTAWCGRRPVTPDIQVGSLPIILAKHKEKS
jgi:hypothetical protein